MTTCPATERRSPGRLLHVLLVLAVLIAAPIASAVPAAAAVTVTVTEAQGTVTASWPANPSAAAYRVGLWDGETYVQTVDLDPPNTRLTFVGLASGTYLVYVEAWSNTGPIDSGESEEVQVSAFETEVGALVVSEFRQSGPAGLTDSYAVISNTTGVPQQLAGYTLSAGDGTSTIFGRDRVGSIEPGASFLVAGPGYSLATQTPPDMTVPGLGSGGLELTAPDIARTSVDAVGPSDGSHVGVRGCPA
jgi:hypothetical protein